MPSFGIDTGDFTPSTTADNWTLEADTAGDFAKVVSIGWGGRMTTSTGYYTRWTRPTTAGATSTATFTPSAYTPGYGTPLCRAVSAWTTEPVLAGNPAGNLHGQNWNAHGGLGYVVLPLSNPWWLANGILTAQIACRNLNGVDANLSGYTVVWEE